MASVERLGFGLAIVLAGCTAILGDDFFIETSPLEGGGGAGATTTGNAGMGGGAPCDEDTDCPSDECNAGTCDEICMSVPVDAGVPCSEGACDGAGTCGCVDDADCNTLAACMPPAHCVCNANTCEDNVAWALAIDPGVGTADITGMTMDPQGNITIAGVFGRQLTFPENSTAAAGTAATLGSDGTDYGFVASYDNTGTFRWAVALDSDDMGISGVRVAAIDNTNVFVSGRYFGNANWVGVSGGASLPQPDGGGAAFLAVLNFDGANVSATLSRPLATTSGGAPLAGQSISDVACGGDTCYFGGLFTEAFTTGGPIEHSSPAALNNIGAFQGALRPGIPGIRWIRWFGGGFVFVPRLSAIPGRVFNVTRFGTRLNVYNQNGSEVTSLNAANALAFFSWDADSGNRQQSVQSFDGSSGGQRSLAADDNGFVFALDVTENVTYEGQEYDVDGTDAMLIAHEGPVDGTNPFPLAHMAGPGDVLSPRVVRGDASFHFAATFTGDFALGAAAHSAAANETGIVVVRLDPQAAMPTSSVSYRHVGAESVFVSGVGTDGQTAGLAAVMGEGAVDFGNGRTLRRDASCPGLDSTCVPIIVRLNR